MPQNTTKNILISVALIAFIISSGAVTIYQLAKRQTNTTNTSQVINSPTSLTDVNLPTQAPSTNNIISSITQTKKLNVSFDAYICGLSVTGFVDKPETIQKLEFTLTNKDKPEIKQIFTPKIDQAKNFKILVDDKIIADGIYRLEAVALLTNQKTEITETTIEFKKDCGNLIQNSTLASLFTSSSIIQLDSVSSTSQAETKIESTIQVSSIVEPIKSSLTATIQSEALKQIVEAPIQTIVSSSAISSVAILADNANNANAVRTGGLDITAILTILMIIVSTALVAKFKTRQTNLNDIFGKK
jgi:hypothetical protein